MTYDPLPYKLANSLLTCFCNALAAIEAQDATLPKPGVCCLRPGVEVPFDVADDGTDMCCFDDGEAYVKIITSYPSSQFPEPDVPTGKQPCQMQRLAVVFELGTIRCIGVEPDCSTRAYKVRQMMADGDAAYNAVCCWGKAIQDPSLGGRGTMWSPGAWELAGPDGLCVSGTMQVVASIKGPGCC